MTFLEDHLRPMPVAGEALRFDLSEYRSTVTRQMLQIRVRMTPQAFGVGADLLAANLTPDGAALEVDAGGLERANAEVRARLASGPEFALVYVRNLAGCRRSLDRTAATFGRALARGRRPRFLDYVGLAGHCQALGALKFCLPETLRLTLADVLEDASLVDALLAPEEPGMWSVLNARELGLARTRLEGPAARYRPRLERHRREFGYLFAEDVDFREHESLEAIDARLAALGAGGAPALAEERRRTARSRAADRARKVRARRVFAERVGSVGPVATIVAQVLLARALVAEEDLNRRGKMRFLRDLRDLAELSGCDLERSGLPAFAAACESLRAPSDLASVGSGRPVLPSG